MALIRKLVRHFIKKLEGSNPLHVQPVQKIEVSKHAHFKKFRLKYNLSLSDW